ncbi:MAG: 4-hydroxy-tetrahydrodipicolinate reductase [Alphaproteobacteria bacterium]|nr:4-hydroxy-tetrahydrodipicolinate reductase [Alphaproteobacteria bacterium]
MEVGIVGCNGRVGSLLIEELQSGDWKEKGLTLAGGYAIYDIEKIKGFFVTNKKEELFERSDVIIDFTMPEGTVEHAKLAKQYKTALVVGTTGLTEQDEKELKKAAKDVPIVYAANMSIGVNILLALVGQVAQRLQDEWDIEIFEAHHKYKVDGPSGTALALGKTAATARGHNLKDLATFDRHGQTGAREKGKIGFSIMRGGDVVGEHNVMFLSEGERLELCHKATNRSLFAKGALHASTWLKDKEPGLYSMRDVLDL